MAGPRFDGESAPDLPARWPDDPAYRQMSSAWHREYSPYGPAWTLVSEGDVADALYREGIERLGRTRIRVELARAHLQYGEWLRRERRRLEAREHLRIAQEMLSAMDVETFAERVSRELLATGARARRRTPDTREDLTAQELQVARLAREGLSNPEIGGRLFISPRTVEYHLSKVFTKLDIGSRHELQRVLPRDRPAAVGSRGA